MGLVNIIAGLFKSTNTERCSTYHKAPPCDVIKEMSEKYGEVDMTPKDIFIIHDELMKRNRELRDHNTKRSKKFQCKATEDVHYARRDELKAAIVILNTLYKKVVIQELNKFPLNKACTIEYVAEYMRVKESTLWHILITEYGSVMSDHLYCNNRYDMRIKHLSDEEINIRVIPGDKYHVYSGLYDVYSGDENCGGKVYNILLPNWRFVESVDSSIFYIERMS